MPLTANSSKYLHILQNVSLIALSVVLIPLCTIIALFSQIISLLTAQNKRISHHQKWRASSSSTLQPRIILITGVGMSKGLAIARTFYRAGHIVIGADFEPYGIPSCGRFSGCLKRFYRLPKPVDADSSGYIASLIEIIKRDKVELWVSCSGVASAIEDAAAAEMVELLTKCKAIQFGVSLTKMLHEKHTFIQKTKELGLSVPETHLITSVDEALGILSATHGGQKFIMKSVGLDDSVRADMSLLPKFSVTETIKHISKLRPSSNRPFVLQQFIQGPEFCTHSVVIRGQVLAFTACPSAELLMHYKALDSSSALFQAMFRYTKTYAELIGEEMTGHFSIDFLLDESSSKENILKCLYPIECNPRAHTAVVLMFDESERMADIYLQLLEKEEKFQGDVVFSSSKRGYYWIGHDLITLIILPLLGLLMLKSGPLELLSCWFEFVIHITFWNEGTYEIWDPWPAWWLYCGYWPGVFIMSMLTGNWWSRCNVSTTKVFRC